MSSEQLLIPQARVVCFRLFILSTYSITIKIRRGYSTCTFGAQCHAVVMVSVDQRVAMLRTAWGVIVYDNDYTQNRGCYM